MLRVDGSYFYDLGTQIRPLRDLADDVTVIGGYFALSAAKTGLSAFLHESIFRDGFKTINRPGNSLLELINELVPTDFNNVDWEAKIPAWKTRNLKTALQKFEAVLAAELQTTPLYYASPKGGFDTSCLTEAGERLFPPELAQKVPAALADVKAATRCIAFDLPTAAGFHLHRATESVLRAYFDALAGSSNRPKSRNMGDYIKKMEDGGNGDKRVLSVLKSLKDLHRNPLMHPDDVISSIDEAISLYAAVRAAIGYMLDGIQTPLAANIIPIAQPTT